MYVLIEKNAKTNNMILVALTLHIYRELNFP